MRWQFFQAMAIFRSHGNFSKSCQFFQAMASVPSHGKCSKPWQVFQAMAILSSHGNFSMPFDFFTFSKPYFNTVALLHLLNTMALFHLFNAMALFHLFNAMRALPCTLYFFCSDHKSLPNTVKPFSFASIVSPTVFPSSHSTSTPFFRSLSFTFQS